MPEALLCTFDLSTYENEDMICSSADLLEKCRSSQGQECCWGTEVRPPHSVPLNVTWSCLLSIVLFKWTAWNPVTTFDLVWCLTLWRVWKLSASYTCCCFLPCVIVTAITNSFAGTGLYAGSLYWLQSLFCFLVCFLGCRGGNASICTVSSRLQPCTELCWHSRQEKAGIQ